MPNYLMSRNDNILFDVLELQILYHEQPGYLSPYDDYKIIARQDDRVPLAIIGSGYKVIQNTELFPAIDKLITQHFPMEYNIHDAVSYGGGLCVRQYIGTSTSWINDRTRVAPRVAA